MERQKQESCRREPVTLRTQWIDIICLIGSLEYEAIWGFPGGSVVKNPPANVENVGSIPDLGRSYMPQSNSADVPQLLPRSHNYQSPCALEPCSKRSRHNEKPAHRN